MQIIIIVLLVLAVLLVIFTLQNSTEITVHLLLWEIGGVPLALVILCCVILGYLLAFAYFYPSLWKTRKENKRLVKTNEELKAKQLKLTVVDENHPEGIELDDDDERNAFFTD